MDDITLLDGNGHQDALLSTSAHSFHEFSHSDSYYGNFLNIGDSDGFLETVYNFELSAQNHNKAPNFSASYLHMADENLLSFENSEFNQINFNNALSQSSQPPEPTPYSVIYSTFNGDNDDYSFFPDGDQSEAQEAYYGSQPDTPSFYAAAENAGEDLIDIAESTLVYASSNGVDIVRVGDNVYSSSSLLAALQGITNTSIEVDIGAEILNANPEYAFTLALQYALSQSGVYPATSAELVGSTIGVLVSDNVAGTSASFAVDVPPISTYTISGSSVSWNESALATYIQSKGYSTRF